MGVAKEQISSIGVPQKSPRRHSSWFRQIGVVSSITRFIHVLLVFVIMRVLIDEAECDERCIRPTYGKRTVK